MKINIKAPAKINLFLEIVNKRSDGYHNLKSIMQTISLYDELSFESVNHMDHRKIFLKCNDNSIGTNETNIVYKTALAVKTYFNITKGAEICVRKKIPIGAGLGGGSSDAAATLKALVKLWNIKTTKTELEQIAVKLGADIPFFLTGGTALCEGVGEIVTQLKSIKKLNLVLVNPGYGISTAKVYKKIKFPLTNQKRIHTIRYLVCSGFFSTQDAFHSCFNRLEEFVFPDYPEISKIKNILNGLGCVSFMSGSGATVFGIVGHNSKIEAIQHNLKKYNWKTWFVTTTRS
ncbi:MAG: 4-(cytidine 5'-diphospho)-2-C-methyl-D-erythritol kinase [Endomicrobium sp.]|jgi:4-diphosphocytidyl-2-C-methyl-D-erythritol kinase|nr:4-(cytidine 5'-diphospho)-2-C-methyl-D-erythritol kinase [Endomicrobium sp.]